MTIQTSLPMNRDSVHSLSKSQAEPAWMTERRLEAAEWAERLELPKPEKIRIDRWPLTAFGSYKKSSPLASLAEVPAAVRDLLQTENAGQNLLIQHNSDVVYSHLSPELQAQGVIFGGLADALKDHSQRIQPYFMSAVRADENRLTALHAALWSGGVFLYVPKNVKVETPIQAIFLADDAEASFAPHILVIAEENSSVTYVDDYVSGLDGKPLVHNGAVEVYAKAGARVRYNSIHHFQASVIDLSCRRAVLDNDADVQWVIGEMNQGNCLSETNSILKGNGSASDAKVICVGTNEQRMSVTTKAVHIGRSTNSDMITRAVMRDQATAIFNGITKIEKGATRSNGQQTEKVLMLSPGSRGDANPMLLIDEDDVMAAHAASAGQINPEQIHYMMSRGISRKEATRLITYGFLSPVISQIPVAAVEEQLKKVVERKLES